MKHKHPTFHAGNVPVLNNIICTKQWCAWIEWCLIWPLFISANPDMPFPVLALFHRIFSFAQKHQMAPCLSNVSGCFLSSSLPDTPLPPNYSFWVWVRSPLPHWLYGFITPLCIACLPACLAWAWTYPAAMSTCFLEVIPSANRWTELDQRAQHFPATCTPWSRMLSLRQIALVACPLHTFESCAWHDRKCQASFFFFWSWLDCFINFKENLRDAVFCCWGGTSKAIRNVLQAGTQSCVHHVLKKHFHI